MTWRCFVVKAFRFTCTLPLPVRVHEYSSGRLYLKADRDMLLACVRGKGARMNGVECRSYLMFRRCGNMMCQDSAWIARQDVAALARLLERVYGPWNVFEKLWMKEHGSGETCDDCVKMCAETLY